ncbi:hypothetical protein Adt_27688 [Abeliophyllum distichum]|uniref:Uncharacterized protein n=1 Tax=Abeliophyllum distichum TaxID=126358 RepID=A0ABD1RUF8_9LAMI
MGNFNHSAKHTLDPTSKPLNPDLYVVGRFLLITSHTISDITLQQSGSIELQILQTAADLRPSSVIQLIGTHAGGPIPAASLALANPNHVLGVDPRHIVAATLV